MDLGSFPYPFTPNKEPVPITSNLPSILKNFKAVLACGHSCISSRIRAVLPASNTASFPNNAESIITILSISRDPEKTEA